MEDDEKEEYTNSINFSQFSSQALMLLLLGVSSIVPLDQEELICSLQNNLQRYYYYYYYYYFYLIIIIVNRSLEPMMKWSHGPPPI